ncbi:hypothetical protein G5I_11807 [Acromyrmex echinatior]|uniref:Uncharacterized protein n=1 Tax=Acromyrmex echinatior TaxID=103372 RepID=F4X0M7_ACREC|nr:hypothetical protein G5I_11807 [Acromyrmex echinatior]
MTADNGDKPSVSLFVRPKIASGDLPFPEQTSPGGELRATDLRAKPQCPHQLRAQAMRAAVPAVAVCSRKKFRISLRGKGAPHILRRTAPVPTVTRGRLHDVRFARALVSSRANGEDSRGTSPPLTTACRYRLCKDGGQWSREEKEDLSYETSHNCTPIGPAVECNLSPGTQRPCICESGFPGIVEALCNFTSPWHCSSMESQRFCKTTAWARASPELLVQLERVKLELCSIHGRNLREGFKG